MAEQVESWGKVLQDFDAERRRAIEEAQRSGRPPIVNLDSIVDSKISHLYSLTQRPLIIYAVDFFTPQKIVAAGVDIQILPSD